MELIDIDELRNLLGGHNDLVLINVLNRKNFSERYIPKSLNISVHSDSFVEKFEDIIPNKDRKIIIYCWYFDCPTAIEAIDILEKRGYTNVFYYRGGVQEWYDKGYKVCHDSFAK